MRNWSTARAVERPSAIAHTTSEAPRCASPHTNTPGVSVCQSLPQDSQAGHCVWLAPEGQALEAVLDELAAEI